MESLATNFREEHHYAYFQAGYICSIVSLVTITITLFLLFLIRKRFFNFFYSLGVYLLIADLPIIVTSFHDPSNLDPSNTLYCNIIGPLRVYSNISVAVWNLLIIWTVFFTVKHNLVEEDLRIYLPRFLALGYLLPWIFAILPIFIVGYEKKFTSCWIGTSTHPWATQLINAACYWGIILLCLILVVIVSIWTVRFLLRFEIHEISGEFYALGLYPVVFILCNAADVFDRVYISFGAEAIVWIAYTHVVMRQLQGFFHGMVFMLNPRVRSEIVKMILCDKSADPKKVKSFTKEIHGAEFQKQLLHESDGFVHLSMQQPLPLENEVVISKYFKIRGSTHEAYSNSSQNSFLSDRA